MTLYACVKARMVLIIVLSLLLVPVSSAKHESITVGPYKISFDLNTTQNYSVNNTTFKAGITYDGTKYNTSSAWLNSSSNFALVTVAHFNDPMCGDLTDTQSSVSDFLQELNYNKIETNKIKIDGQQGIVGHGVNSNGDFMFAAQYWQKSGTYFNAPYDTNVLIESDYPWYNTTFSLLKSIQARRSSGHK